MPLLTTPSYYRLKVNINCPGGGIVDTYNLKPGLADIAAYYAWCIPLLTYRSRLLAANSNVVNAVLSLQKPTGINVPDGVRMNVNDYGSTPTMYIPPNEGGDTDATITVTNTFGVLSAPVIVDGGNYPDFADANYAAYISDQGGPGSGATGTFTITGGVVTAVAIAAGGVGYTNPVFRCVRAENARASALDSSIGIEFQIDTSQGKVEKRLIRCIRNTWIRNGDVTFDLLPPFAGGVVNNLNPDRYVPEVAIDNYLSYVRDGTILVLKQQIVSPTPLFQYYAFDVPGWSYIGIGKRPVGYAWPKVQGRKPVLA